MLGITVWRLDIREPDGSLWVSEHSTREEAEWFMGWLWRHDGAESALTEVRL